jgi:TolB-like protein/class 3 adenylate cyclase/Tfp pilus assembly protein PilF
MSETSEQRKLAAIMFTDMVGYSALSQRDDKLALELLEEHRRLLREIFPRFHGTEIKTIGDAFLVEFNSALEAAQCAIEIQRTLAKRNADALADRQIELKIGIHIGDVVHRGGDVYGDGVNIASRIEPLAGAGGICVSMDVERQIRNAVETRFEKLAPTELKNISVPMELFRIVLPWERQAAPPAKSEIRIPKSEIGGHPVASAATKLVLIGALLVAVAIGSWWWTTRKPVPVREPAVSSNQSANIPEKSIAVLPFDNLSSDKENAYFAEGIQDEILTRLSKIAALKVISRTSTQKYKSAPDNLREIGNQLGVANILEGSVQKIANAVHINVQLIRAATDEHLWAESYNRKLDDVFGVEGEVATAIADQLNAKLTGSEQKAVAQKPTENLAAYDAYLRALSIEHERYGYDAYQEAAAQYATAVQLDPKFALAWARLGVIRSFLNFNGVDLKNNSAEAVKHAADTAMSLQPELAESWIAQGAYRYRVLRDFAGALHAYEEGNKRAPNNAFVYQYMAFVERRLGRWNDADAHYEKAAKLDPQNLQLFVSYGGEFLNLLRRFAEAHAALDRALQISPNDINALANKANVYQIEGRLPEAAATLARIPADTTDDFAVLILSFQAMFEKRYSDAAAILERKAATVNLAGPLNTANKALFTQLGYYYEWAGQLKESRAAFERALAAFKPSADSIVAPEALGAPAILALTYAGLRDKDKALAQARQAVADYSTDAVGKPPAEVTLAQIQARFGDIDSAIAAIPHLLEVPSGITVADLKFNPLWDSLRKDPRFQRLCQESNK